MLVRFQSESVAARRILPIKMVDLTDGYSPKTGITVTVQIRKNNGAWASAAGTVSEPASGNGSYDYAATAGEMDTVGNLEYRATGTACRPFEGLCDIRAQDPNAALATAASITTLSTTVGTLSTAASVTALPAAVVDLAISGHTTAGTVGGILNKLTYPTGAVAAGSNTATTFVTNLSYTGTDAVKDLFLRFTSGALVDQAHRVASYNGSTKAVTMATPFTATPANADTFELVNR